MRGLKEAIKRRRASKVNESDYAPQDGLVEENKKLAEVGLAPEIEDRGGDPDMDQKEQLYTNDTDGDPDMDQSSMVYDDQKEKGAVEEPDELSNLGERVQLNMQKPKSQTQELDNLKGMYDEGDEKKKGFMGKAAQKMKERLSQIKK